MGKAYNVWLKEQPNVIDNKKEKLKAEIELSETIYAMDYTVVGNYRITPEDDARLVRLERKIDAIIQYLTED